MMLASEEAAELLHVSLRYLIELLANGNIPGAQKAEDGDWCVPKAAVLQYKAQRNVSQAKASADVVRVSRDLGLYDDELEGIPKAPNTRE